MSLTPLSCAVGLFIHSFKTVVLAGYSSLCLGLSYSIKLDLGTKSPFKNIKIRLRYYSIML